MFIDFQKKINFVFKKLKYIAKIKTTMFAFRL